MKKKSAILLAAAFALTLATASWAQVLFTDAISPAEFKARRARVFDQIGDAVVVMQGTTETSSYLKFRQKIGRAHV